LTTNICQCLHQLIFALKVKASIESDFVTINQIDHRLEISETNTTFNASQWKCKEDLVLLAENAVNLAIAGLSIAADEELDLNLGQKDSSKTDFPFNLRAVIYQIRNSFAHNLLSPTFQVKSHNQRSYRLDFLPGKPIIDFSALNGRPFTYSVFGGFDNFYALFETAETLVQQSSQQ
jgi:hypothetical protein